MSIYDPPSDPFGDEKHCRICDGDLLKDPWTKEFYCPNNHEELEENTVLSQEEEGDK